MPILLCFLLLAFDEPRQPRPGTVPAGLFSVRLADPDGRPAEIKCKPHRATVLFFLGTECPVSNFYAPELRKLAADCAAKGVACYGIYSEPELLPEEVRSHASEYKLTFPLRLDPSQELARACGIRKVLEVAVLRDNGELAYRGRVDDRFDAKTGKRRPEPRTRELVDALEAVLAGKPVAVPEAEGYGCPLTYKK